MGGSPPTQDVLSSSSSSSLDLPTYRQGSDATRSTVLKSRPSFKNQIDKTCCCRLVLSPLAQSIFKKCTWLQEGLGRQEPWPSAAGKHWKQKAWEAEIRAGSEVHTVMAKMSGSHCGDMKRQMVPAVGDFRVRTQTTTPGNREVCRDFQESRGLKPRAF